MNFRKYVLAGKGHEVVRYIFYVLERSEHNMRRVSNETENMFIEGHLLFNLAGYNPRTHACLPCMSCRIVNTG